MSDMIDIFAVDIESTREDKYSELEYKSYSLRREDIPARKDTGYYSERDPVSMIGYRMSWPMKESNKFLMDLTTDHLLSIARMAYLHTLHGWSRKQCTVMLSVVLEILTDRNKRNTLYNHETSKEVPF